MMMGQCQWGQPVYALWVAGPSESVVTACAAGTHAIGNGARVIADGRCDAMLAGGSEAPFTPTAVAGFANMTALSSSGRSRPFDVRRDGFVMAEGAAVLVLEDWTALSPGELRYWPRCSARPPHPTLTT